MCQSEFLLASNRNNSNERILGGLQTCQKVWRARIRDQVWSARNNDQKRARPFGLVSTRLPMSTTCCSLHRQLYETRDVAALGLDIATMATSKGKNHIGGT